MKLFLAITINILRQSYDKINLVSTQTRYSCLWLSMIIQIGEKVAIGEEEMANQQQNFNEEVLSDFTIRETSVDYQSLAYSQKLLEAEKRKSTYFFCEFYWFELISSIILAEELHFNSNRFIATKYWRSIRARLWKFSSSMIGKPFAVSFWGEPSNSLGVKQLIVKGRKIRQTVISSHDEDFLSETADTIVTCDSQAPKSWNSSRAFRL